MRRAAGEAGQASLELVAMVPLLVAVALVAGQVLAVAAARELAGHAAEAAAIALLREQDVAEAAAAALPAWSETRMVVRVRGRRVAVRLRPAELIPGTARLLEATATADAGPG